MIIPCSTLANCRHRETALAAARNEAGQRTGFQRSSGQRLGSMVEAMVSFTHRSEVASYLTNLLPIFVLLAIF